MPVRRFPSEGSRLPPPSIWRDVCLTNRDAVLKALKGFRAELKVLEDAVAASDAAAIEAFFAAGETALTATSRARMAALERQGNAAAKRVNALLGSRERLIGAMLIGNNVVNIGASALMTTIFVAMFGDAGVIFATGVMSHSLCAKCPLLHRRRSRRWRASGNAPSAWHAQMAGVRAGILNCASRI